MDDKGIGLDIAKYVLEVVCLDENGNVECRRTTVVVSTFAAESKSRVPSLPKRTT